MKILLLLLLVSAIGFDSYGQSAKINIGTEQDILPYLTGGYYGSVWAGKNHLRGRILTARVKKPDLIVPEGFDNNWVTAWAFLGEYFLKENWQGVSVSGGFVYWQNTIELQGVPGKEAYDTYLLNGSLSYTFKLYRHLYIAPWAGLHLKVGGPKTITIDGESFDQPVINPEASVKIGIYL